MCVGKITNPDVLADCFDAFDSDEDAPDPIEDEHHAIFESSAYAPTKQMFPDLFPSHVSTVSQVLKIRSEGAAKSAPVASLQVVHGLMACVRICFCNLHLLVLFLWTQMKEDGQSPSSDVSWAGSGGASPLNMSVSCESPLAMRT